MSNDFEKELKIIKDSKWIGKNLIVKEIIESTQTEAHILAKKGSEHGTIIIADEQTDGRGRIGRKWVSGKGKGVWLSIILRPSFSIEHASFITLFTSIVLNKVIKNTYNIDCKIKWPNDIYIGNKKCSGILTELNTELKEINYLIIGVGINTHKSIYPKELKNKVISLEECLDYAPNRILLINNFLKQFEIDFDLFNKCSFTAFYEEYLCKMYGIEKEIRINGKLTGRVKGINKSGHLLVETSDGEIISIASGEIEFQ